ncbi:hypothetical protein [Helicobacter pylori]
MPPNGGLKRYLKNAKIRSLIYFNYSYSKNNPYTSACDLMISGIIKS